MFFNQDFEKILKYSKQFSDDTYWLDIKILIELDWSLIMRMMSKMLDELKIHDQSCTGKPIHIIVKTYTVLYYIFNI